MHSDFRELLSILNAHRVKYLIVGAYAVAIYAQPRATKDLDILVKADAENAQAVFAALSAIRCAARRLRLPPTLRNPARSFAWGANLSASNIPTAIPGVEFDAAWPRRVEDVFDEGSNLRANFISREDLLAAKRAAGRPQDLADVQ